MVIFAPGFAKLVSAERNMVPVEHSGKPAPPGYRGIVAEAGEQEEAALPEPDPHPTDPRPVDRQVRRAVGGVPYLLKKNLEATMERVFEIYIKTTRNVCGRRSRTRR
jgi:hypothetical protein